MGTRHIVLLQFLLVELPPERFESLWHLRHYLKVVQFTSGLPRRPLNRPVAAADVPKMFAVLRTSRFRVPLRRQGHGATGGRLG